MKLEGIKLDIKKNKIEKVFEDISEEEYRKRLGESQKVKKEREKEELIRKKKEEILERLAIEELIKEGRI